MNTLEFFNELSEYIFIAIVTAMFIFTVYGIIQLYTSSPIYKQSLKEEVKQLEVVKDDNTREEQFI